MEFKDLGLSNEVLKAVTDAGYTTPTPIQEKAIPEVLKGRDVLGLAQTGTGKTASFTLPMIDILARGRSKARMPRSLILEPTRELAAQVADSFEKYGKHHKLSMALLIGGVSFEDQERKLDRGVDVLIATPGRLLDHFGRGKLMLTGVQTLVIDEADRMLDMGFIPDVEKICKLLPFTRQTLFFSATMPGEIQRLVDQFLHNPVRVEVARPATAAETITQAMVTVASADKREALRRLIRQETIQNAIVFCNRKRDVDIVFKSLQKHGFSVGALHGDMDQRTRMKTLDGFKNNEITLLVASDVAARGLDIPAVSHVFNFDVPFQADDYVHRIGRTGRAGRSGAAFMIATGHDAKNVAAIEKLMGRSIGRITLDGLGGPAGEAAAESEGPRARGGHRAGDGGRDRSRRGERGPRPPRERQAAQPAREPDEGAGTTGPKAPPAKSGPPRSATTRTATPRPAGSRGERPDRGDAQKVPANPAGLGDHVPAFLMRPTPIRRKQDAGSTETV